MAPTLGHGKICYLEIPAEPGIVISVMVDDAATSVEAILAAGGEIVRALDLDAAEKLAWFRDPGGNVLGIYQTM